MSHLQVPYNVQTFTNVTALRGLDIEYINNTGRTLFCYITLSVATPLVGDRAVGVFKSPSTFSLLSAGLMSGTFPQMLFSLTGIVKPGNTYKLSPVIIGNGAVAFSAWIEVY